ncbi:MAG: dihydrodipicolinate synthase family protein [Pseudomonadota bacterium]
MADRFTGVMTPLLTPYNNDGTIAYDLYCAHASYCLKDGAHYLSPFGTTSEAPSHSIAERRQALETLVQSGSAKSENLMPGTGLCALQETVELCRHASELGCAGVMVLPPFFLKPVSDEGLYRYFGQLIERLGANPPAVCLYNIPQNSGVPISPDLAARLNKTFPEVVLAYKDSSGDWSNTKAVIEAAPEIAVFPGSETVMPDAMALGGGGCISASCNSNVRAIRALYDAVVSDRQDEVADLVTAIAIHREALSKAGLIPGLKSLMAHLTGDERWLNLRAPLLNADQKLGARLAESMTKAREAIS